MGFSKAKDPTKTQQQAPNQQSKLPSKRTGPSTEEDIAELLVKDPEHPVHKIPLEKREKWRAKGINPVSRAEMDEVMGKKGFWSKIGSGMLGGGGLSLPTA